MNIEKEIEEFKIKYSNIACESINQFISLDSNNVELQQAVNDLQINLSNGWLALTDFLNVLEYVKSCNEKINFIKSTMFLNNPNFYQKSLPQVKEAEQAIINDFVPIDLSSENYIPPVNEINNNIQEIASSSEENYDNSENINEPNSQDSLKSQQEDIVQNTVQPAAPMVEGNAPLIPADNIVQNTVQPVAPMVEGNAPLIPADNMVQNTLQPAAPMVEGNAPLIPTDNMVQNTLQPAAPMVEGNAPLIPIDNIVQNAVQPAASMVEENAPLIPLVSNNDLSQNQNIIPTISVGGDKSLEDFNREESLTSKNNSLMPLQAENLPLGQNENANKEVYKKATSNPPKAILVELNQFNNLAISREKQKEKIETVAVSINLEEAMKQAQSLYASGQVEQAEKIMNMIKVKSQPAN